MARASKRAAPAARRETDPRTRRALIERLKELGPQDARSLAEALGVSPMAVRQHLYVLEAEKLVTYREESRPIGRPAKLWGLTPAADRFFPDGHAELTLSLIAAMEEAFGAEGLDCLLAARAARQVADYRTRVRAEAPLAKRLAALAKLRTEEGYMASVDRAEDGAYLLLENHCPICAAAKVCQGLCAAEQAVFEETLGPDVTVERVDHILSGARRCAYRVTAANG